MVGVDQCHCATVALRHRGLKSLGKATDLGIAGQSIKHDQGIDTSLATRLARLVRSVSDK